MSDEPSLMFMCGRCRRLSRVTIPQELIKVGNVVLCIYCNTDHVIEAAPPLDLEFRVTPSWDKST